jgi:hypothetical protein
MIDFELHLEYVRVIAKKLFRDVSGSKVEYVAQNGCNLAKLIVI